MELQAVRGTRDLLPGETEKWAEVEKWGRAVFAAFGYRELRTPLFEHTELFQRGVGETTDIVTKEMYTFEDRKGRSLTLRPEGTAPVVRAYLEHHLGQGEAGQAKLYYLGPMFRYERPQAGRYRQFFQIGAEAIGYDHPSSDAESISMLVEFLARLGLSGLSVDLNTVGCPDCRPDYHRELLAFLKSREDRLSPDSRERLGRNPLRVLDSKLPQDIEATAGAPKTFNFLCTSCSAHFAGVQRHLGLLGVPFELQARLVRGLDYYTRTVFEVKSGRLGAQNAVAGGGRYDQLVGQFGGPARPAVGFGVGLDRLMALLQESGALIETEPEAHVAVVAVGEKAFPRCLALAHQFRRSLFNGFPVRTFLDLNPGRGVKSQMKRASASGATYAVILGDEELAKGEATVKDMVSEEQFSAPLGNVVQEIGARLELKGGKP